jgi:hypothetical protein
MVAPVFTLYNQGSTPTSGTAIGPGNKVSFLNLDKGMISSILTIDIWNDKGGLLGCDTAIGPRFFATNGTDIINPVFAGTITNNFKSMIEARSCGAYGTTADQQSDWTPISPTSLLVMGNMPSNTKRSIEIRLNVPIDAANLTPTKNFLFRVSA